MSGRVLPFAMMVESFEEAAGECRSAAREDEGGISDYQDSAKAGTGIPGSRIRDDEALIHR